MKLLKQGVCLALLGAGLAAVPGLQAQAADTATAAAGKSLVQQMRDEAQGSVALSAERATGKVGFIRAGKKGDLMPALKGDSLKGAIDKASAYLDRFAPAFGARAAELEQTKAFSSRTGWTVVYTQAYKGVPVFGSMLKANIDKQGDLTAVNGYVAPGLDLSVTPRVSAAEAGKRAVATVRANPPGEGKATPTGLRAADSKLTVYRIGAVKGEAGKAVLAWQVEVTNGSNIRDAVLVDAVTGKFLNRFSLVHSFDTDRELYVESPDPENLIWKDGDEFPGGLDQEQQNLVLTSGNTYWTFANTFGFDSFDGEGGKMIMVNDYVDPDPAYCPNANWNGSAIRICEGTGPDDVVAHEWGHAYTQYTSDLIYQWQSGALNESYSDVWGESIDLINNREDGGEGDLTAKRPDGKCSTHSPPGPLVTINSPAAIARDCVTGGYLGPDPIPTITEEVVAPTDADEDGDAEGGTTLDGCSEYDDPAAAAGKIVLVNRGLCTFVEKAQMAKDMGAVALIIGNRDRGPVGFSDADQTLVPTVSIGIEDREAIRSAITGGETVNATIQDSSNEAVDSYRWLMGEKSEAFGGAIRDMWNPTCHGDPGKVTDVYYNCSSDDSGGVHGNSGVPNHAYALAVDGGTFNGQTITGMGLDKAANIWWQAQTAYLTPTSDFVVMADALEQSCADLTGAAINKLEHRRDTAATPAEPITPADCAELSKVIEAVELRVDPTESCGWEPLLQPGNPGVCGKDKKATTVWKENFEDGLKGWSKSERVFFEEGHGIDWRAKGNAPKGHGTKVAFAPDPTSGSCAGDSEDISSANAITSKAITLSGKGSKTARMTFQHYMASEAGWDGGNVMLSVNGKKFAVVPDEAYLFNAPNSALFSLEEGNSNPKAGESAFTGTNDGESAGSWGNSQIDLKAAGVGKGDKFKIRFDFGRDGCNGVDGWYVDNVKVVKCLDKGKNNKLATRQ